MLPVHQQCVELHTAVAREERAAAGVEGIVIFHDRDGGLYRVEAAALLFQHAPPRFERRVHATLVGGNGFVRHGPGAPVDKQNGSVLRTR